MSNLASFTDVLGDADEIANSQPMSIPSSQESRFGKQHMLLETHSIGDNRVRPNKHTGQRGDFRSIEEIDPKYRGVFSYPFFNLVQSSVIEDALYSDKSMVVCAPTGSGKTVIFEMAIVQLLMELEDRNYIDDFKIIYMAPVKALCTERLTEWYPKFTKFGHLCIEVTGDTDVDFSQLKPYRIIITTPEKWDMLTRRWRDHRGLVEVIKLFLIDEVHILNDETRGPVLEAVVSRMKTIEASSQSAHRIEQLQKQYQENNQLISMTPPRIRFVAVSATVSNPEDVAAWLESGDKAAVFYKFGDECRPVKLKRVVEGYPCPEGMSIFKFDIILNYKLWPIIQKYHDGKPTLIFCNTRKSVLMTAETLSKELTINFTPEQKSRLTAVASTIKNKKLQSLVLSGVGCHHAGLLFEERLNIENAFRNRDLPILITTTTLAMGVNLPAHLVVIKNTQQYVNGAYQEYSISTVLQMVGRAGRPQFDTEATAVIMTRLCDKPRYQALVSGSEPLQSYLHKRLAENLNSEAALGTVCDVAQCVQWLRSTFLCIRAARDPRRYLGIQPDAPPHLINKKIEELCVKAMNGLASSGLITMDEASCIYATEAGRLMSIYYLDLETMKHIMKIEGSESLEQLLRVICESHELADMHLRVDERRCLNTLNRNNAAATIRFPIKGKISTRQMKLNCIIQAVLGCLTIPDPSLNQEAMKVMRIADRICKCLVAYVTRPDHISTQPKCFSAALNALILAKSIAAHLWENSPYVSKQLKGIGPAFSTLLASAGKINFTLLEESHPRDLERIMNKSAPAGNVVRKQISLLPKYQLVMTPISNNKASIQLTLLNHPHLAENIGQLTAGETHKCHIIVGDSENHILLLICFKDKDLIGIYNGTLTYEITRIHNFEHKVFAHCISSNFVGLDVQSEYLFKGLEPLLSQGESMVYPIQEPTIKKMFKKQTTITDSFKERKRKINDLEISQSKEKKKRDNAVIEKFRHLKGSLGKSSTELREKLQKPVEISNKLRQMTPPGNTKEINHENSFGLAYENENDYDTIVREYEYPEMISENLDNEQDFTADDHFDNILNEIENEISKTRYSDGPVNSQNHIMSLEQTSRKNKPNPFSKPNCKLLNLKTPTKSTRCNYNFIELLQRRENLSNEDDTISSKSNSGFSDTIKSQVEKFIMNTSITTAYTVDPVMKELISNSSPSKSSNKQVKDLESCPENLMLHNNKIMDKNTTIVLKPPENLIVSPEHLASVKEHDVDITKGPEVTFGTSRSNNDIDQIPIKGAQNKNQNDFTHENNKVNVISLVNQKNKIKDLQENLSPEMILDDVNNKREFSYFSHELLKSSCDLKKFDHRLHEIAPEKCRQNNNLKITILEQERKGNLLEVEDVEIVKDDTDTYVLGPDSHEKYIPKENLPSLSDVNLKQVECANNNCKFYNQLMLPNFNTMSMNTSHKNTANLVDKLNQASTPNRNSERQPILYFNKDLDVSGIQYFNETKQSTHLLPHKTIKKINTNILPSMSENSLQKTNYEKWENFELHNDTTRSTISKETASFSPLKSKNEKCINTYSFSTMKIDIQTKKHADLQVQIIRKLKVDLDVTEILTREDKDVQNNKGKTAQTSKSEDNRLLYALKVRNSIPNTSDKHEDGLWPQLSYEYPIDEMCVQEKSVPKLAKNLNEKELVTIQGQSLENPQSTEGHKDKLENILQKYSKILRKNNNLHEGGVPNDEKKGINLTSQTVAQTSRPYKIQDINKHDISFPITIMNSVPEVVKSNNDDIIAHLKALRQKNRNVSAFKHSSGSIILQDVQDHTTEQVTENYEDPAFDETLPKTSNLETIDFDIDQSMFNPKTLLQCLSKDSEFVPPPVQFSDDRSTMHETFSSSANIEFEENNHEFSARSIFDTNAHAVLTPTKEIETWTFSQDDNEYKNFNLKESCTVMRINSPITSTAACNVPRNNRKAKLDQFTYKVKNKLKI